MNVEGVWIDLARAIQYYLSFAQSKGTGHLGCEDRASQGYKIAGWTEGEPACMQSLKLHRWKVANDKKNHNIGQIRLVKASEEAIFKAKSVNRWGSKGR